jgi:hypothetical protein
MTRMGGYNLIMAFGALSSIGVCIISACNETTAFSALFAASVCTVILICLPIRY